MSQRSGRIGTLKREEKRDSACNEFTITSVDSLVVTVSGSWLACFLFFFFLRLIASLDHGIKT